MKIGKRAYKLLTLRKDGTIGPLFINRKLRIPIGEWLEAEDIPTKGYAHRPGWHVTKKAVAPHLTTKGRVWYEVRVRDYEELNRPVVQGGTWFLAKQIKVVRELRRKER
jgi:hypothetical protein